MDLVFWIESKKIFSQNIAKINLGRLSPLKKIMGRHIQAEIKLNLLTHCKLLASMFETKNI